MCLSAILMSFSIEYCDNTGYYLVGISSTN